MAALNTKIYLFISNYLFISDLIHLFRRLRPLITKLASYVVRWHPFQFLSLINTIVSLFRIICLHLGNIYRLLAFQFALWLCMVVRLATVDSRKTRSPFLLQFFKHGLLLGMYVIHKHVFIVEFRKYDHCWFDSLVNVALSKRRGQDYNTGVTLFRKAVDAVVVVFVEHPELVLISKHFFTIAGFNAKHWKFDRWVRKDHV